MQKLFLTFVYWGCHWELSEIFVQAAGGDDGFVESHRDRSGKVGQCWRQMIGESWKIIMRDQTENTVVGNT